MMHGFFGNRNKPDDFLLRQYTELAALHKSMQRRLHIIDSFTYDTRRYTISSVEADRGWVVSIRGLDVTSCSETYHRSQDTARSMAWRKWVGRRERHLLREIDRRGMDVQSLPAYHTLPRSKLKHRRFETPEIVEPPYDTLDGLLACNLEAQMEELNALEQTLMLSDGAEFSYLRRQYTTTVVFDYDAAMYRVFIKASQRKLFKFHSAKDLKTCLNDAKKMWLSTRRSKIKQRTNLRDKLLEKENGVRDVDTHRNRSA